MDAIGFTLFETPIGTCGIAWSERGIVAVRFPEADPRKTAAALARRHPGLRESDPPPTVRAAIDGIAALLRGEPADFSTIALDLAEAPDFNRRVYDVACTIKPGETLTYGEVAERLGDKSVARAVGRALGENPVPILVPCHRVLAASGRAGGFSAPGGVTTKLRILSIERARIGSPGLFDDLPLAVAPGRA